MNKKISKLPAPLRPPASSAGFIVEEPYPEDDGQPAAAPPVKTGPGCLSRLFGLFGIAVTTGLILAFLAALKYSALFLPAAETSGEVVVAIPEGASPARIGEILERAGAIKSAEAFVWALRAKNRLGRQPLVLKAGEMALVPPSRSGSSSTTWPGAVINSIPLPSRKGGISMIWPRWSRPTVSARPPNFWNCAATSPSSVPWG